MSMAAENGRDTPSPPGSPDQTSPPARAPRRQFEDEEPRRQDKSFRRYAAGVERALASFDNGRLEWPDYISFLGRLLKAIQAHPPAIDSLPHRFTVATRLAQCLKPSLPSGVHQKAIEVYSYIFSLIGKDNLTLDLHVYLPGLSPVLTFASLSLRPFFLALFETHILALNESALRPALKALILSLIPGLEDETSEDFDRTLQIVDSLKDATVSNSRNDAESQRKDGNDYFWQCFFLASISSPSRRQGCLAFLNRRLPVLTSSSAAIDEKSSGDDLSPDAESTISPEPGLLIRCLSAGLQDEQMLIQRGYLDLLLSHLPLNSPVLRKHVDFQDLVRLIGAATSVVIRRDMSLNRRLWSWFLGPEATDETNDDETVEPNIDLSSSKSTAYFLEYGAKPLIANILETLSDNPSQPSLRAKPFRICLSLMDRPEVGSVVVPKVFLPAMENISRYQQTSSETNFQDALRSAHGLFDGVESGVIWGQILRLITITGDLSVDDDTRKEELDLAEFVVNQFNVQEEEMLFVHLPLVTLASLASVTSRLTNSDREVRSTSIEMVGKALLVIEKFVRLIPERAELNSSFSQQDADIEAMSDGPYQKKIIDMIQLFYSKSQGNLAKSPPPFSSRKISELLIKEAAKLMRLDSSSTRTVTDLHIQAGILSSLIGKMPSSDLIDYSGIVLRLRTSLQNDDHSQATILSFTSLCAITQLLRTITTTKTDTKLKSDENLTLLVTYLSEKVWDYLSPSCPKYHLEAVDCLWQLDELIPEQCLVEALISKCIESCMSSSINPINDVEPARKFAVLWTHTFSQAPQQKRLKNLWSKSFLSLEHPTLLESQDYQRRLFRPLFLLLDASDDTASELQFFLRGWLEGLPNIYKIFEVLLTKLSDTQPGLDKDASGDAAVQHEHMDRTPDCAYFLQRLASLLNLGSESMWQMLCQTVDVKASESDQESKSGTILQSIAQTCLEVVQRTTKASNSSKTKIYNSLQRTALSIISQVLECPDPESLQSLQLEDSLIDILRQSLRNPNTDFACQIALLDALSAALSVRSGIFMQEARPKPHKRLGSIDTIRRIQRPSAALDSNENLQLQDHAARRPPPSDLVKCLQEGLKMSPSVTLLEKWIQFLVQVLPFFSSALFQNLIPLVETFCRRISTMFEDLKMMFENESGDRNRCPDSALASLLTGLEATLIAGHGQMAIEEPKRSAPKSPEVQQSGFFGNVVSGVFSSEGHKSRNSVANTRLTVILCFQDALRVCLNVWSWGGVSQSNASQRQNCGASLTYVAQRLRNKTRRILDSMFISETLECLEALISIWAKEDALEESEQSSSPISLLHVLESSSPKQTMPAIFNSIYSRTTPASIDSKWMSTLSSDLSDVTISKFLLEYTQSLDDDAMEEIWTDCMAFLRDVLANPLPHRQILPNLLHFLVILAEKMDKTNFGEQRKMRKDLGDLFLRHLTATFTTKSGSSHQETSHSRAASEQQGNGEPIKSRPVRSKAQYLQFIDTLTTVVPRMPAILSEVDRLSAAVSSISTSVISPLIHSKNFPSNVKEEHLSLWLALEKITSASKIWRKDTAEAFMHLRFFSAASSLAINKWAPLIHQWSLLEKERVTDLCARIAAPTSAGLVFGVGANTARLDADKKTQLNLRRLAFLTIVSEEDFTVSSLALLEEKVGDLLHATIASSPSSATRAEVFMLLRALILNTSLIHLSFLWPLVSTELQRAISSALPRSPDFDTYNVPSLLQACKLLDLLLTINPDDFQAQEWLFITDTIDAVYRPSNWSPVALVDDVAEELGYGSAFFSPTSPAAANVGTLDRRTSFGTSRADSDAGGKYRTPLLSMNPASLMAGSSSKDDFVAKQLKPFFAQLSMHAYESTYKMREPDFDALKKGLVEDLFDDSTLVG